MPRPTMQRRHFCFIAEVIAKELFDLSDEDRAIVALAFANNLKATNGQFKRERFLAACIVPEQDR